MTSPEGPNNHGQENARGRGDEQESPVQRAFRVAKIIHERDPDRTVRKEGSKRLYRFDEDDPVLAYFRVKPAAGQNIYEIQLVQAGDERGKLYPGTKIIAEPDGNVILDAGDYFRTVAEEVLDNEFGGKAVIPDDETGEEHVIKTDARIEAERTIYDAVEARAIERRMTGEDIFNNQQVHDTLVYLQQRLGDDWPQDIVIPDEPEATHAPTATMLDAFRRTITHLANEDTLTHSEWTIDDTDYTLDTHEQREQGDETYPYVITLRQTEHSSDPDAPAEIKEWNFLNFQILDQEVQEGLQVLQDPRHLEQFPEPEQDRDQGDETPPGVSELPIAMMTIDVEVEPEQATGTTEITLIQDDGETNIFDPEREERDDRDDDRDR
jgi:hypothetical protein